MRASPLAASKAKQKRLETLKVRRTALPSLQNISPADLVHAIQAELPFAELEALRANVDLPLERLATILGIARATLHRRKASGKPDAAESDRVVRYIRLEHQATEVFTTVENARQWLSAPQVGLGGAVSLQYAATEVGAREAGNLLGRIEYGVYA